MKFKLGWMQRVLLTIAVPAIAVGFLWPIHREASVIRVNGDVVERSRETVFLRNEPLVQLGMLAALLVWVYVLWLRAGLWGRADAMAGTPMPTNTTNAAKANGP